MPLAARLAVGAVAPLQESVLPLVARLAHCVQVFSLAGGALQNAVSAVALPFAVATLALLAAVVAVMSSAVEALDCLATVEGLPLLELQFSQQLEIASPLPPPIMSPGSDSDQQSNTGFLPPQMRFPLQLEIHSASPLQLESSRVLPRRCCRYGPQPLS